MSGQEDSFKNTSNNAVLVIKISDNYLRTRINSEEYAAMISVDDGPIFYSSDRELYGKEQTVPIDYEKSYFQYMGTQKIGRKLFCGYVHAPHIPIGFQDLCFDNE